MGTWGAKNFENDTAGDYYLKYMERWATVIDMKIEKPAELYASGYWSDVIPCIIEILTVLAKQDFHCSSLPEPEKIIRWKSVYMDVWEATIDKTGPKDDYRKERKEILIETFDNLIKLSKEKK